MEYRHARLKERELIKLQTLAGAIEEALIERGVSASSAVLAAQASSVVRLAPMVHSDLDLHGFTSALTGFARESGAAAYIADGANRWPAATPTTSVRSSAWRSRSHPPIRPSMVLGIWVPFKVIAETIAGKLGIGTKSITEEEAPHYLGFLAGFAGLDNPVSNDATRQVLGWEPTHPGWVEDIQSGHYIVD